MRRNLPRPLRLAEAFRAGVRLVCLTAIFTGAAAEWVLRSTLAGSSPTAKVRATWLQRVCRRIAKVLALRVTYEGVPSSEGLLVCNHLSYLDIIAIAARNPTAFVAKKEVRRWPVIGWLAECGGSLFIDREQRADVVRVGAQVSEVITQGTVVCMFAEGTSSDGADILPFRPSLLQPAIAGGWTVTPAWIGYALAKGSVANEVCYWRDMSFGPHFLNLLTKNGLSAQVRYGHGRHPATDRKALAAQLHAEVRRLGRLESRFSIPQPPSSYVHIGSIACDREAGYRLAPRRPS